MGAMTTCRLKRSPAARKRSTWTNTITRSACVHSTPISKCSRYSSWRVIRRTLRFTVVIRCLLRPSNELRRAMETFNRYIDGGRKRDPTTDLHRIENPNAKYGLVARMEGSRLAESQATRLPLQSRAGGLQLAADGGSAVRDQRL